MQAQNWHDAGHKAGYGESYLARDRQCDTPDLDEHRLIICDTFCEVINVLFAAWA